MKRAIIIVLDSLGLGASADAHKYGDVGSDTLGHIAEHCAAGKCNSTHRQGMLDIPNLQRWGLAAAATNSREKELPLLQKITPEGAYGYAREVSVGKDTPSGHWEMCGLPVPFEWGTFPDQDNCFPQSLLQKIISQGQVKGTLANRHASGTQIIEEFGEEHMHSGLPICYASADSVFQIAAHEQTFGLQRLYKLCEVVKRLVEPLNITRVIARPFIGTCGSNFERTANRRDLTTPPTGPTLLDHVQEAGSEVVAVGKIGDIFSEKGITRTVKADGNMDLVDELLRQMQIMQEGLLFVNLVDFDTKYGHRRNVTGYAHALEQFDARLPEIEAMMHDEDIVLITADHGCDPTWPGSSHTREHVPVVFYGHNIKNNDLGKRASFADMGQTIAKHLNLAPLEHGKVCNLS
ncbi:MAG: phosphopentomutase [Gammaproteobacteria bacterium]|nr:phosphopentomutase [Gammaproteobacteria bacterium]